ncbi:MAG: carboxypeptidase-like regulatory domain-containing protein [Candidatus Sumerlaeota bacterium]
MEDRKKFLVVIAIVIILLIVGGISIHQFTSHSNTPKNDLASQSQEPKAPGGNSGNTKPEAGETGGDSALTKVASSNAAPTATAVATPDESIREALRSPAIIIRGKVFMPDNSPAKNAPVVLQRHIETFPTGYGGGGQPSKLIISDLDSTMTDGQGRYEVGAKELKDLVLQAHASGTATASLSVRLKNVTMIRRKDSVLVVTINVRLTEGSAIHGIVVDEKETPIGEVELSAFSNAADWSRSTTRATLRAATTSGTDGRFEFDQFGSTNPTITARKAGYAPVTTETKTAGGDIKIVLKNNGGVVAGKVLLMGKETPIEHAQVQLFARLPVNMGSANSFEMDAESDEAGSFRIENVPPGNYMLVAKTNLMQMVSSNSMRAPDFGLGDNETRDDFILYLGPGTTIRGTVSDGVTHEPIAGALVHSAGVLDMMSQTTATTGEDGRYVLENVYGATRYEGTREAELTATKNGYAAANPRSGGGTRIGLSAGQAEATQDLELFHTVMVNGRVMTPQNAPVVGARVTINSYSNLSVVEPTDPLGRFSIPMIANRKSQLRVDSEDFAMTYSVVFEVKDEPVKDLVIVVDPGATVVAHVVDPDGKKVEGAQVWIMVRTIAENWSSAMMNASGETSAAGSCTFTRVPTRDYPLSMDLTSISPALGASKVGLTESVEARPELHSNETTEVTLTLRGEMKNFAAGIVRDPYGKPLQGVRLQYYDNDLSSDATTGADGTFRIGGLGEPPYNLTLFHADYGMDRATVNEADRTDLEFVIGKNQAILTCIVMDADTQELIGSADCERFMDGVAKEDIGQPIKDPATPGTFRIPRARTGEPYNFRVTAAGYETGTTTVTIPEGEKEFIQVIELKKSTAAPASQ